MSETPRNGGEQQLSGGRPQGPAHARKGSLGQTLKRTITGLSTPSCTYSAADQITDFGAPLTSAPSWTVVQLSDAVGDGYVAEAA